MTHPAERDGTTHHDRRSSAGPDRPRTGRRLTLQVLAATVLGALGVQSVSAQNQKRNGKKRGAKGEHKGPGPHGQRGPRGLVGPTGPAGSASALGATGPTGPQGPAGGPQGPQGALGPQGDQGLSGEQGPQGPAGTAGAQGPAGLQGPDGAQGAGGSGGAQGPAGPQGDPGAQGTQGSGGAQGATGATGSPTCPAGTTFIAAIGCVETGLRGPHKWNDARQICPNFNRRLMSLEELVAFAPVDTPEWSANVFFDANGQPRATSFAFNSNGTMIINQDSAFIATGVERQYRCMQPR